MRKIDYIIPLCNIGDKDFRIRCKNISFILREFLLKQLKIDINIIIVEQIIDDSIPQYLNFIEYPDGISINKISVKYPIFVKPWLYNIGIKKSISENIIFGEADIYCKDNNFLYNFLEDSEGTVKWCFIWDNVIKLSKEGRNLLIEKGIVDRSGSVHVQPDHNYCEGMGVYFNKSFFRESLGWANEMFRKLGGNDNELAYRSWKASGTYIKYPKEIIHLWHPISSMKPGKENSSVVNNRENRVYVIADPESFNRYLISKECGMSLPLDIRPDMVMKISPTLRSIAKSVGSSGSISNLDPSILKNLNEPERNRIREIIKFRGCGKNTISGKGVWRRIKI